MNRLFGSAFGVATILLAAVGVLAQGMPMGEVIVGGHFDIQSIIPDNRLGNHDFAVGQFGLTVSTEFTRKIAAHGEVALDINDQFVLDEGYLDFSFFTRARKLVRQNTAGLMHVGLIVGRFDVPFGIDHKDYNSPDRPLVTMPMVIANTHRGWNDVGALFHGHTTWSEWAVWAVNEFGQSQGLRLEERPRVPELAATHGGEHPITEAFGLRLGIIINNVFQFGSSFAAGYTDDDVQDEKLFGFDLSAVYEGFEFKGEFIRQERYRTVETERTVWGYYLQAMYRHDRYYGVIRQGGFEADGTIVYPVGLVYDENFYSTSIGAGIALHEHTELRGEYRWYEGSANDLAVFQTVVGF